MYISASQVLHPNRQWVRTLAIATSGLMLEKRGGSCKLVLAFFAVSAAALGVLRLAGIICVHCSVIGIFENEGPRKWMACIFTQLQVCEARRTRIFIYLHDIF